MSNQNKIRKLTHNGVEQTRGSFSECLHHLMVLLGEHVTAAEAHKRGYVIESV